MANLWPAFSPTSDAVTLAAIAERSTVRCCAGSGPSLCRHDRFTAVSFRESTIVIGSEPPGLAVHRSLGEEKNVHFVTGEVIAEPRLRGVQPVSRDPILCRLPRAGRPRAAVPSDSHQGLCGHPPQPGPVSGRRAARLLCAPDRTGGR